MTRIYATSQELAEAAAQRADASLRQLPSAQRVRSRRLAPASALRVHLNTTRFLDTGSASLLSSPAGQSIS